MKADWRTLILCFFISSCTTVGIPDKTAIQNTDFGPQEKLRICIYKDINISDQQADDIITALQQEFSHFDLIIEVPWVKPWERPAYTGDEIMNNFAACPLADPGDDFEVFPEKTEVADIAWARDASRIKGRQTCHRQHPERFPSRATHGAAAFP